MMHVYRTQMCSVPVTVINSVHHAQPSDCNDLDSVKDNDIIRRPATDEPMYSMVLLCK